MWMIGRLGCKVCLVRNCVVVVGVAAAYVRLVRSCFFESGDLSDGSWAMCLARDVVIASGGRTVGCCQKVPR